MPKINPRAYLEKIKNVRRGVITRSRILDEITSRPLPVSEIAKKIGRSESAVRRHLKNMEVEGIVDSTKYKRRRIWNVTGAGQKTLDEEV